MQGGFDEGFEGGVVEVEVEGGVAEEVALCGVLVSLFSFRICLRSENGNEAQDCSCLSQV